MAAGGAPARTLRRGPAPIASFDHDHDGPDPPDTKPSSRLPEICEDPASCSSLGAPAAPRIDISRASSSSHHDSRDSSPELALFAGGGEDARSRLDLAFREEGALELRSSTEELAFLEAAPPAARRHSRKDSQGSEAALLAVAASGRTSRISSVGSQCSAHSAHSALSAFSHASHISRLSVVSGVSRSPSPHRMLLETSFCGPKPIETDPEICAAAVEERLLEIAKFGSDSPPRTSSTPVDARDRREVRTEATVERASRPPPPSPAPSTTAAPSITPAPFTTPAPSEPPTAGYGVPSESNSAPARAALDDDKLQKESQNRAKAQERRARPRVRREPSEPEVYKSGNLTKDIIRIKLKPDDEYEDTAEVNHTTAQYSTITDINDETGRKPTSLELAGRIARPTELVGPLSPSAPRRAPRDSRTPSPAGGPVSRKSSFCSLFKSRETIASPDSPSDALRRKRSLTEDRSRSKSRDRSATPSSVGKIRGSVLSLFRTPRKSCASPSTGSREGSPVIQPQRAMSSASQPIANPRRGEKLKYYEDSRDGIIHIPLRTPPDEGVTGPVRPASAVPPTTESGAGPKPIHRTVLPDGSIIIPLRSPTEKTSVDHPLSSPVNTTTAPVGNISTDVEPDCRSMSGGSTSAKSTNSACLVECTPETAPNIEPVETAPSVDDVRRRKKERIIFTTHVGSREQVFSTQFSITKTPSVTSEISGSFPSFVDPDESRSVGLGLPGPAAPATPGPVSPAPPGPATPGPSPPSPGEGARDSSESEASSECAPPPAGSEVERRGLVVQDSFEEELPYVPTTLPQERSLALPMVPVRERAGVLVRGVDRPRAAAPAPLAPAPPPASSRGASTPPRGGSAPERLRIQLPRRAPSRPRTRSTGDESRPKTEWIDFEEVPERRKQPKRIQTLPTAGPLETCGALGPLAAGGTAAAVVFSYVEPDQCRCECHARDLATPARSEGALCGSQARCGSQASCGSQAPCGSPC